MISPRYATTFCFVETDARIDASTLDRLTAMRSIARSTGSASMASYRRATRSSCRQRNGRRGRPRGVRGGARRADARPRAGDRRRRRRNQAAGRIIVRGEHAEPMARAVANSPLVKTALYGGDRTSGASCRLPAWLPLARRLSGRPRDRGPLGRGGRRGTRARHPRARRLVQGAEIEYRLTLPGSDEAELFFSDLSPDYVHFNSEYTS